MLTRILGSFSRNRNVTTPAITYFTNSPETRGTNQFPQILNPSTDDNEIFALGNSVFTKPFLKVTANMKTFEEIVRKQSTKPEIKAELLQFLKSTQP